MKRIYISKRKTKKRRELEAEALGHLRRVRAKMQKEHPGLLSDIRRLYEAQQKPVTTPSKDKVSARASHQEEIPIDRAKNMETIARFLQITDSEMIKRALLKHV